MSPRYITTHHINDCNRALALMAHAPKEGGAPVRYDIIGPNFGLNIRFQDGPVADGINGITNEALLAILKDRLTGFQSGPFACSENEGALCCIQAAQSILAYRTRSREARGVEGTHQP